MTPFHHHHQDTLRENMRALAMAENAHLYRRNGGEETYARVRAVLSLAPMMIPHIADLARCAPVTAARKLKQMEVEGVVVRTVVRGGAGGMAYLYALRAGVLA